MTWCGAPFARKYSSQREIDFGICGPGQTGGTTRSDCWLTAHTRHRETTRRKEHYQNSISRCITPSSNHSLVRSHFPSKRKCQTRNRIGAKLCEAPLCDAKTEIQNDAPRTDGCAVPHWSKRDRTQHLYAAACMREAKERKRRRRAEGSHVQSLKKRGLKTTQRWQTFANIAGVAKGSPRQWMQSTGVEGVAYLGR